jgi:acyl carrier protein
MYRTGDVVRHHADGTLEFLSRVDHQVKVRGFRVELPEIEAALLRCPGVGDAAVVASRTTGSEQRLIAYCAPSGSSTKSEPDLRSFLEHLLPAHMIPDLIVFMETLPRTPTGKIDRNALPTPSGEPARASARDRTPHTPTQTAVAQIWERILGISGIGIDDNFFELGGHSLLAMQVASRIADAYKVDMPLRDVFESPTVAGLAERIEERIFSTTDEETLASALEECEGLDQEHVQQLLKEEGSPPLQPSSGEDQG